jgi:hypothetical protein
MFAFLKKAFVSSWRQRKPVSGGGSSPKPRRATLQIEAFEDRLVPAVILPVSPVAVNPQPLPPSGLLALSSVAVNPQRLPPGSTLFALSPFAVNPQPLPPGIG